MFESCEVAAPEYAGGYFVALFGEFGDTVDKMKGILLYWAAKVNGGVEIQEVVDDLVEAEGDGAVEDKADGSFCVVLGQKNH